ncbi:hypothetical protein [Guptibacillus algicola]|uniref:hypothetical protein n=1 Tax=Guptibacillus algicola TaxID=225844 RepID=UPI001CD25204|nr:hypothetical protein [Alkalihalobacillus algicola]MCA0987172.1 hypothetical protein [Alkalihalobacillus algicola]
METIYWILYALILLSLLLFAPVEFAFIFMIGGFFVIRHLPRKAPATQNVAATHERVTPTKQKHSKLDVDFDDDDDEEYEPGILTKEYDDDHYRALQETEIFERNQEEERLHEAEHYEQDEPSQEVEEDDRSNDDNDDR